MPITPHLNGEHIETEIKRIMGIAIELHLRDRANPVVAIVPTESSILRKAGSRALTVPFLKSQHGGPQQHRTKHRQRCGMSRTRSSTALSTPSSRAHRRGARDQWCLSGFVSLRKFGITSFRLRGPHVLYPDNDSQAQTARDYYPLAWRSRRPASGRSKKAL
jgi:hypothetical protein